MGIVTGETEQLLFSATVEGDFTSMGVQSPWADQGVTGLVGWETRSDELTRLADDISQIPGGKGLTGTGGGTLPIAGEIEVDEVFLEVSVPVISGLNFAEEVGISWLPLLGLHNKGQRH